MALCRADAERVAVSIVTFFPHLCVVVVVFFVPLFFKYLVQRSLRKSTKTVTATSIHPSIRHAARRPGVLSE